MGEGEKKRKRKRRRREEKKKGRSKVWKLRVFVWMLDFGMDFCLEFSSFM